MGNIIIRNLPDDVHSALKSRAAAHHRSTEAEVRAIIAASVATATGTGLGQQLRDLWGDDLGDEFENLRDKTAPAEDIFG